MVMGAGAEFREQGSESRVQSSESRVQNSYLFLLPYLIYIKWRKAETFLQDTRF
jgi:hypothetical protein